MQMTTVQVPTADGEADAYLIKPDGDGPFPGVLVFMDAFGLRPRLAEMAERIAERGYAVLVPNLFYRSARSPLVSAEELSDAEKRGAAFGRLIPMMKQLTPPPGSAPTPTRTSISSPPSRASRPDRWWPWATAWAAVTRCARWRSV